jgi:hypothetical protein
MNRAWDIRMARIWLAQAAAVRRFPQHSAWHARCLQYAANRRRRAAGEPRLFGMGQGVLFEDMK